MRDIETGCCWARLNLVEDHCQNLPFMLQGRSVHIEETLLVSEVFVKSEGLWGAHRRGHVEEGVWKSGLNILLKVVNLESFKYLLICIKIFKHSFFGFPFNLN